MLRSRSGRIWALPDTSNFPFLKADGGNDALLRVLMEVHFTEEMDEHIEEFVCICRGWVCDLKRSEADCMEYFPSSGSRLIANSLD
mmetsp:Transcript_11938/g.22112  ORF Transcript_11938/g.22112 Transcript_11938/m.22112 type:complete len:86 (+) Transcript_11938:1025-1282(+)